MFPQTRMRRFRRNENIRKLVRESRVHAEQLIYPIFVVAGEDQINPVNSMPGIYQYSLDHLLEEVERAVSVGINSIILFGVPAEKDAVGSGAYAEQGIVQEAIRKVRAAYPDLVIIADCCLCEYTDHGHCGLVTAEGEILNDATLNLLTKTALSQAAAGADIIAPSDMMDGRVAAIRAALDQNGFTQTPIMAYSAKFASSFYGPFREAAKSAPSFGDRKSYQMDYHNRREAVKEALLDAAEGADIVMVKPAMAYGDLIREIKEAVRLPAAAYSVSGEYAMVKAASAAGYIEEAPVVCEMAACAYRAGADIYISYFAEELAGYIERGVIG